MSKFEPQGMILRLVGERQLSTRSDVVEALRDEGLGAVQGVTEFADQIRHHLDGDT